MIRVFKPTDKTYTSNGDCVLIPIKAKVHKEDNEDFYLDLECGQQYSDCLVANNIVVAPTPQGDQAFRLSNPDRSNSKIKIKAWHVFYDSANYLIEDTNVVSKNANQAFKQINDRTVPASEFTVDSNITTIGSFRPVRMSLREAIESMMDVYGGHLVRDNFHLSLKKEIGVDRGITIQYGKNLKELSCLADWDDVVTKLMPVGKDGLLLPEKYLVANVQYEIHFVKAVSFPQDLDRDDYSSDTAYQNALIADLRSQGKKYLDKNKYPQVNYTLKAHLDEVVDIGDIIEVKDERINVDIITSVISYEYDCLLDRYTQIEFGNFKKSLPKLVPTITSNVDQTVYQQITNQISSEVKSITDEQIDDIMEQ